MHKVVLDNFGGKSVKKLVRGKNRTWKSVNNHKTQVYRKLGHKLWGSKHNMSKELGLTYASMAPIYEALDAEFSAVDLIDLELYERWLNG